MKYKHDGKSFAVLGFTKQNLVLCRFTLGLLALLSLGSSYHNFLLQVLRHQFMGSQVVKIFPPKDDEVGA